MIEESQYRYLVGRVENVRIEISKRIRKEEDVLLNCSVVMQRLYPEMAKFEKIIDSNVSDKEWNSYATTICLDHKEEYSKTESTLAFLRGVDALLIDLLDCTRCAVK